MWSEVTNESWSKCIEGLKINILCVLATGSSPTGNTSFSERNLDGYLASPKAEGRVDYRLPLTPTVCLIPFSSGRVVKYLHENKCFSDRFLALSAKPVFFFLFLNQFAIWNQTKCFFFTIFLCQAQVHW